jgi:hypothetical protein
VFFGQHIIYRDQPTEEARLQIGKDIREAKKEARLVALFGEEVT